MAFGLSAGALAAVGSVGGAVVGGIMSAGAQEDAANTAAGASKYASDQATKLQREMYDQTNQYQTPYRESGYNALAQLNRGLGLSGNTNANYNPYATMSGSNALAAQTTGGGYAVPPGTGGLPQYAGTPYAGVTQEDLAANEFDLEKALQASRLRTVTSGGAQYTAPTTQQTQQTRPEQPTYNLTGQSGDLMRKFGTADFEVDPGYQFRLAEGMKALDRTAAARGGLLSGSTLKGAQAYNQGMASQEYQNAFNRYTGEQTNQFNRLASMANLGQTANAASSAAGQNYANAATNTGMQNASNQGNAALAAGNANASMYSGAANSIGNALGKVNWGGIGSTNTGWTESQADNFYGN